jgi:superfamily II DNA or RNA helicase
VGKNSDFEEVIRSLGEDSFSKGIKFERVLKWWLQNDEIWSKEIIPDSVKLWEESPHRSGPDIGIDLTATDIHGNSWAIQAKNWNPEAVLPKSEIDKFLSASNTKTFQKRLLVTTTNTISANALRAIQDQEKPVVVVSKANLEESGIWELYSDSLMPTPVKTQKSLFPHQIEAINQVFEGLREGQRGQLLMACGSGKTITAQRIQERLEAKTTLILLPSLLLVQQTLRSWRGEAEEPFSALSVCSDSSVNGDEPVSKISDLPFPVTTNVKEIEKFLKLPGKRVIFSTYQSSQKIEEALKGKQFSFDLVICDEAHRLAGKVDKAYGTVLRDGAIPSKNYIFMTATPRIFSSKLKETSDENNLEIHSMDDVSKFGPVLYNFSFAKAIENNVLTDYKVIVMGVDDSSIRELVENRQFMSFEGTTLDAATLAAHFGIAKAMQAHSIRRVISFHSRVERAREFATTHQRVVSFVSSRNPKTVFSEVISGKDSVFRRKVLLDKLKELQGVDFGLVTNARCLTEGVDVPSLDGVAFVDPRSSQVDIVQAVGRAIRRGGMEKKVGFIILPVFFSKQNLDEQTIDESQFAPVWKVLNALKSHDAKLEEEINTLRRGLGKSGSRFELPSRIIFDFPFAVPVEFASKIKIFLLEKTSSIWEEWFAKLEVFSKQTGHCMPKRESKNEDEKSLAGWVSHQRTKFNNGHLDHERVRSLETLPGWTWDARDTQWMEYFTVLQEYAQANGTSRVPSTYKYLDEKPLGKWVAKLRSKRGTLSRKQIELLETLPDWTWDPFGDQWELAFSELRSLAQKKGGNTHFSKREKFSDGRSVSGWVIKQRQDRELLTRDQILRLESIAGWSWDPFDERNSQTMEELEKYLAEFGNTEVPQGYVTKNGFKLGQRVSKIRGDFRKGAISPGIEKFVTALPGWTWNKRTDDWESRFAQLVSFTNEFDRLPKKDESFEDEKLGWWVSLQRQWGNAGTLSEEKRRKLETVKHWTWSAKDAAWEKAYFELVEFNEKHKRPPKDKEKSPEGTALGSWVYRQRKVFGTLSSSQQERLKRLPWFKA